MIHQEKITQGFKWCILAHTHVQMWSFFCAGLSVAPLDPPLHSAAPVQQSDVD